MRGVRILALVGLLATTVTLTTVHSSAARAAPPAPVRSTAADRARSALPDSQFCRKILNYSSRRVLDADLNTIGGNGTKVQLWGDLGPTQYNQIWCFDFSGRGSDVYKIHSDYGFRDLDADWNNIDDNGAKVQLWDDLGPVNNQLWWLVDTHFYDPLTGNELYKLYEYYNFKLLDADLNTIDRNGTKVQIWDDLGIGQWNQYWELI